MKKNLEKYDILGVYKKKNKFYGIPPLSTKKNLLLRKYDRSFEKTLLLSEDENDNYVYSFKFEHAKKCKILSSDSSEQKRKFVKSTEDKIEYFITKNNTTFEPISNQESFANEGIRLLPITNIVNGNNYDRLNRDVRINNDEYVHNVFSYGYISLNGELIPCQYCLNVNKGFIASISDEENGYILQYTEGEKFVKKFNNFEFDVENANGIPYICFITRKKTKFIDNNEVCMVLYDATKHTYEPEKSTCDGFNYRGFLVEKSKDEILDLDFKNEEASINAEKICRLKPDELIEIKTDEN